MVSRKLSVVALVGLAALMAVGYQNCGGMTARGIGHLVSAESRALLFEFWSPLGRGLIDSVDTEGSQGKPVSNPTCSGDAVSYPNRVVRVNCQDYADLLSLVGRRYSVTSEFWQSNALVEGDFRIKRLSLAGVDLGPELMGRIPRQVEVLSLADIGANRISVQWNTVLKQLDLSGNMLSDAEVKRQAFPTTLTHINLAANLISSTSTYSGRAFAYTDLRDNPVCGQDVNGSVHVTCKSSVRTFVTTTSTEDDCSSWVFEQGELKGLQDGDGRSGFAIDLVQSTPSSCLVSFNGGPSWCFHNHALNGNAPPILTFNSRINSVSARRADFNSATQTCTPRSGFSTVTSQLRTVAAQDVPVINISNPKIDSGTGVFEFDYTAPYPQLVSFFQSLQCTLQVRCRNTGSAAEVPNGSGHQTVNFSSFCRNVPPGEAGFWRVCFGSRAGRSILFVSGREHDLPVVNAVRHATLGAIEISRDSTTATWDFTATFSIPEISAGTHKLRIKEFGQNWSHIRSGTCFDASPYTQRSVVSEFSILKLMLVPTSNCQDTVANGTELDTNFAHAPRQVIANLYALACSAVPGAPHLCGTTVRWEVSQLPPGKVLVLRSYTSTGALVGENITCIPGVSSSSVSLNWASSNDAVFELQMVDACNAPPDRSKGVASISLGWSGCAESASINLQMVTASGGLASGTTHCRIPSGQAVCSPAPKVRLTVSGNSRPQNRVVVRVDGDPQNFIGEVVNTTGLEQEANFVGTSGRTFRPYVLCEHGAIRTVPVSLTINGLGSDSSPPTTLPPPPTTTLAGELGFDLVPVKSDGALLAQSSTPGVGFECLVTSPTGTCSFVVRSNVSNLDGDRGIAIMKDGGLIACPGNSVAESVPIQITAGSHVTISAAQTKKAGPDGPCTILPVDLPLHLRKSFRVSAVYAGSTPPTTLAPTFHLRPLKADGTPLVRATSGGPFICPITPPATTCSFVVESDALGIPEGRSIKITQDGNLLACVGNERRESLPVQASSGVEVAISATQTFRSQPGSPCSLDPLDLSPDLRTTFEVRGSTPTTTLSPVQAVGSLRTDPLTAIRNQEHPHLGTAAIVGRVTSGQQDRHIRIQLRTGETWSEVGCGQVDTLRIPSVTWLQEGMQLRMVLAQSCTSADVEEVDRMSVVLSDN